MKLVVKCPCGTKVRVELDLLHRKPRCPHCKRPIKVSLWQRLIARVKRPVENTYAEKRSPQFIVPPPVTPGVEQLLQNLAERAWRKDLQYPDGSFLLSPTALVREASAQAMETNLRILYEHARRWAPGLMVPYKVPKVRISGTILPAGQYCVDSDGWVSIDVSTDFAYQSEALFVVLAHEACHHILDINGLDDKRNRDRNERLTDLAMFVFGFGDIVNGGRKSAIQTKSGYAQTHLGYLEDADYAFAYAWVLEARAANGLPCPSINQHRLLVGPQLRLPDLIEQMYSDLKVRLSDAGVRQRLLESYRAKYRQDTEEQIIMRILSDRERDNR